MAQDRVTLLLGMLDDAWDRTHWHVPLWPALAGLSADGASWRPDAATLSVGQHVAHVAFWTAAALRQLTGEPPLPEERGDNRQTFGPAHVDDRAWTALRQTLVATHSALRSFATMLTDEDLAADPAVERAIAGVAGHHAYHTGEIVLLRRLGNTWQGSPA